MDSDHMLDIISKAAVLVEALPYVQEFRGRYSW